jgi:intracellular sulfur oxidation DsrE/DsrF family protein
MRKIWFVMLTVASFSVISADMSSFADGTVIKNYGKYVSIPSATVSQQDSFKIAFDVAKGAEAGEVNRQFDSLARFINMHVASGVPTENIELALVVHGRASMDLLDEQTYQRLNNKSNANIPLLTALMKNKVRVILCGQTAAAYEINANQLIEGVQMELSAMTAHAFLQQQGYTVNPF